MTLAEKIARREELHLALDWLGDKMDRLSMEWRRLDKEISEEQAAIYKAEWEAMTPEEQEAKIEQTKKALDILRDLMVEDDL